MKVHWAAWASSVNRLTFDVRPYCKAPFNKLGFIVTALNYELVTCGNCRRLLKLDIKKGV